MRFPSMRSTTWARGLTTWLVYTVTGLLALSLAAPNTHVSPLFLAAGLGLGLTLGWGSAMIWALGLGAASMVAIAHAMNHTPVGFGVVVAHSLACGCGAALQVWIARKLVTTPDQPDLPLDRPGQVARFLLLAGPVASMTNALISVPVMVSLGLLPLEAAFRATLGWWAGDTLGVLVGAPMALTLVGRPATLWRSRRLLVGVPLLVSTVLLSMAIRHVQHWEIERESVFFERDVAATSNAVKLRLNGYLDALEAMHGLYQASQDVDRQEFHNATNYWLTSLQGIQAMGWDERLSHAALPAFEAKQRADGLDQYQVFDRDTNSANRLPPKGDEIVALRFIEPMAGNERALGYNVLSNHITREAFEQSRREGHAVATPGFQLVQESGSQLGVVVYRPVYKALAFTPQARMQANKGAVFMALRMDDALKAMVSGMPDYLSACLLEGGQEHPSALAGQAQCDHGDLGALSVHRRIVPIEFADRPWHLVIWAHAPIPVVDSGTTTWLFAAGGVAFAAALGAMLLVVSGHTQRMEAAMQEASAQRQAAEAANRAKSEFLSRMSHELRTPLNAVLGFAQVMDIDTHAPLQSVQHERLQQIQQAGWHLLDMIDDVLDISRIETGTLRLNTEPIAVAQAIVQACQGIQSQANNLGIKLNWPADIPAQWGVMADPARLRQILGTLLDNGITYNQRPGSVTVSVTRHQAVDGSATMVILVKDTGMGMSQDQVAQLFQPFNRLGREKQIPDGAGVGLAIGRHLATLMGGQLEVYSDEGQGATFTLTLPAADLSPPKQDATGKESAPAAVPSQSPKHILYVEDNLANSEVIRAALADRTWIHLSVAPTIEQGLTVLHNRLQGRKPDLILLDVHLPDASGQEFLRLVKANPDTSAIPVIMISADAMPEQIDTALSAGAACYLTKPVQLAALLTQVDELLSRSDA